MTKKTESVIVFIMMDFLFLGCLIDNDYLVDRDSSGPERIPAFFMVL